MLILEDDVLSTRVRAALEGAEAIEMTPDELIDGIDAELGIPSRP